MSTLESILTLEYHEKRYTVAYIMHSNNKIPIVLNREIYKLIKRLDKRWYINDKNHVYCMHGKDGNESYQVYLHDAVMRLADRLLNRNDIQNSSIIHINNIHFDNRIENLQYDTIDKDHSKNSKKKRRTIDLSHHGIEVEKLPTYIWYVKPDISHGDRFAIEIPNAISWRSTASRKVSLRYKLEEAKKYLRHMKDMHSDLFKNYSMNGDLTATGLTLYDEYRMMIGKAGFTMADPPMNNTDIFISPDTHDLTDFETFLLYSFDPTKESIDVNTAFALYEDMNDE